MFAQCKHTCPAQNGTCCHLGKSLFDMQLKQIKDSYVSFRGKQPPTSDEKLLELLENYQAHHPKTSCKETLPKMMEVLENYEKYHAIVDGLKTDERIARNFFFNNPTVTSIFKHVNNTYKNDFKIDSSITDISTFVYEALWENDWRRLNSYRYESSLYTWLGKVASNILLSVYIDQGCISPKIFSSAGCYRLALRSQNLKTREYAVNLVKSGQMHDILHDIYVNKLDEQAVADSLGVSLKLFRQMLKSAETCLVEELLKLNNVYTLKILRHKKEKPSTWQAVKIDGLDMADNSGQSESDSLMNKLVGCTWQFGNLDDFLYYVSEHMGWNDIEKWIWQSRYFKGSKSKEMAARLGRAPSWIDVKFFRLNKALASAIKKRFAES